MKKVFCLLTVLLFSVSLQAQNAHLSFKGIPMDGDYKAFAQKLVQKGLKVETTTSEFVGLSGRFMHYLDVMVFVYPNPTDKFVSSVVAAIDAGKSWASVEDQYNLVVATYQSKYGQPSEHIEEFTEDVYDSDTWRLMRLRENRCNYYSKWELDEGTILIQLAYSEPVYYVLCFYYDKQNQVDRLKEILEEI